MPPLRLLIELQGGDRRSLGRSEEVARAVLKKPRRFPELLQCLWADDPIVRMRAADAAEKVSAEKPRLLDRYKGDLLGLLEEAQQSELRWHLALMVPRLRLTGPECHRAAAAFRSYLNDRSSIVKTFALQGLADLAQNDAGLRPQVKQLLIDAVQSGTPAMKARAQKLLKQYPA
jgi:hypothetical protein